MKGGKDFLLSLGADAIFEVETDKLPCSLRHLKSFLQLRMIRDEMSPETQGTMFRVPLDVDAFFVLGTFRIRETYE